MHEDIAIIGMSGRLPHSEDLEDFHLKLCTGTDFIGKIPEDRRRLLKLDEEIEYHEMAYLEGIDLFDNDFFDISNKEAANMSPEQRISLELVAESIWDAGYSLKQLSGSRCAVYASCPDNEYDSLLENKNSLSYIGSVKCMYTGKIGYHFNLCGPNMVVDTGCSSVLVCLHEACVKLIMGEADYALAGGLAVYLTIPEKNAGDDLLGIESVGGRTRPFDWKADGTGVGEGGGFFLMKRLKEAQRDRDHIYGVIIGSTINGDGNRCSSVTSPSVDAQKDAMISVWQNEGINPEEITEIEAHGTGTKLGDPIEVLSITESLNHFNISDKQIQLGSIKSNLGHLGYVAGFAGVLKVLLGYKYHVHYPIANFEKPNPLIDFDNSPLEPTKELIQLQTEVKRLAGINSFGLSGTNAHVLIKNYIHNKENGYEMSNGKGLIKISAKSEKSFYLYLDRLIRYLRSEEYNLHDLLYTLNTGRDDYKYRRLLDIKSSDHLIESLDMISPSRNKEEYKLVYIMLPTGKKADCVELRNTFPLYDHYYEECLDGEIAHMVAMYQFMTELGFTPDYVLVDEKAKAAIKYINSEISREELTKCLNGPLDDSKRAKAEESICKITADQKLVLADFSAEATVKIRHNNVIGTYQTGMKNDFHKMLQLVYNHGSKINWDRYYWGEEYHRISAPGYCFDRKEHWRELKGPYESGQKQLLEDIPVSQNISKSDAEVLTAIWQDILEIDGEISSKEDFFELGGNSLLITMLTEAVKQSFGVTLNVSDIYDYGTVEKQLELIHAKTRNNKGLNLMQGEIKLAVSGLEQNNHNRAARLCSMQKTFLYSQLKYPYKSDWNLCIPLRVDGGLNIARMKYAFEEISKNHNILRCVFRKNPDEYEMVLSEDFELDMRVLYFDMLDASPEERDELARKQLRMDSLKVVDIFAFPPLKLNIYQVSDNLHYMLVKLHHLVADGWSLNIIFNEMCQYYEGAYKEKTIVQFDRFVEYEKEFQNSQRWKEMQQYWQDELKGFKYQYQLTKKKSEQVSSVVTVKYMVIDVQTTKQLNKFIKQYRVSVFHTIMLAYHLTIAKRYKIDDSCIGMMTANRNNKMFENTVGLLTKSLPSRFKIEFSMKASEAIRIIREKLTKALENQACSINETLGQIVGQNLAFDELFNFVVVLQNFGKMEIEIDGLKFNSCITNQREAPAPLAMAFFESEDIILASVEYNPEYFNAEEVGKFIDDYQKIIKNILMNPENTITEIIK